MADGDEEAVHGDFAGAVIQHRLHAHAGHTGVVAQHFINGVMPDGFNFAGRHFRKQFVLHDFFGTQSVAAMHQIDLAGDVGQVQRFFHSGIAAADHGHILILVEETIAGGAGRHAAAFEGVFGRNAQIFSGSARCNDERIAGVFAGITHQPERALRQVGGMNMVKHGFGIETLSMCLQARHQIRAHQAVRITGPVVHFGSGHQLATHLHAGDDHGLEVGAGGIHGRGPAGGARAENEQGAVLCSHGGGQSSRAVMYPLAWRRECSKARRDVCNAVA